MVYDLDTYRAANLLITRYGDNASIEASRMIDRMSDLADTEGQLVWRRIKRAVEALQAGPNEALH